MVAQGVIAPLPLDRPGFGIVISKSFTPATTEQVRVGDPLRWAVDRMMRGLRRVRGA